MVMVNLTGCISDIGSVCLVEIEIVLEAVTGRALAEMVVVCVVMVVASSAGSVLALPEALAAAFGREVEYPVFCGYPVVHSHCR